MCVCACMYVFMLGCLFCFRIRYPAIIVGTLRGKPPPSYPPKGPYGPMITLTPKPETLNPKTLKP